MIDREGGENGSGYVQRNGKGVIKEVEDCGVLN